MAQAHMGVWICLAMSGNGLRITIRKIIIGMRPIQTHRVQPAAKAGFYAADRGQANMILIWYMSQRFSVFGIMNTSAVTH